MSLFAELKHRNVIRVAMAYAVLGWVLPEVSSVVMPAFGAPEWVMKVIGVSSLIVTFVEIR